MTIYLPNLERVVTIVGISEIRNQFRNVESIPHFERDEDVAFSFESRFCIQHDFLRVADCRKELEGSVVADPKWFCGSESLQKY